MRRQGRVSHLKVARAALSMLLRAELGRGGPSCCAGWLAGTRAAVPFAPTACLPLEDEGRPVVSRGCQGMRCEVLMVGVVATWSGACMWEGSTSAAAVCDAWCMHGHGPWLGFSSRLTIRGRKPGTRTICNAPSLIAAVEAARGGEGTDARRKVALIAATSQPNRYPMGTTADSGLRIAMNLPLSAMHADTQDESMNSRILFTSGLRREAESSKREPSAACVHPRCPYPLDPSEGSLVTMRQFRNRLEPGLLLALSLLLAAVLSAQGTLGMFSSAKVALEKPGVSAGIKAGSTQGALHGLQSRRHGPYGVLWEGWCACGAPMLSQPATRGLPACRPDPAGIRV